MWGRQPRAPTGVWCVRRRRRRDRRPSSEGRPFTLHHEQCAGRGWAFRRKATPTALTGPHDPDDTRVRLVDHDGEPLAENVRQGGQVLRDIGRHRDGYGAATDLGGRGRCLRAPSTITMAGESFTVADVYHAAISESSNEAYDTLVRIAGLDWLNTNLPHRGERLREHGDPALVHRSRCAVLTGDDRLGERTVGHGAGAPIGRDLRLPRRRQLLRCARSSSTGSSRSASSSPFPMPT